MNHPQNIRVPHLVTFFFVDISDMIFTVDETGVVYEDVDLRERGREGLEEG